MAENVIAVYLDRLDSVRLPLQHRVANLPRTLNWVGHIWDFRIEMMRR
ncbi:MAG: hypothetical protein PVG54_20580 [Anaerolineae bacterium]|jgi:hypothetical protein